MSYRDLRNLLESLRVLGYPRLVSMENFREPNFPLVAEILQWLTLRYDPNADLPFAVDTEQDRVLFIKAIARFLMTKGGVRMNTKKLYRADGHAVKEIIKLADLLTSAMDANTGGDEGGDADGTNIADFDLSAKEKELKATRALASEITTRGAALHELLGGEVDLREARSDAIARPLDVDEIESGVQRAIAIVEDEIGRTKSLMDNLGADEANLESKIDRKKADLERNSKKLRALEGVRPPFMDEYEKIETELQAQYTTYIERFRNLTYLENQLELAKQAELDKFEQTEQTLKRMHERMQRDVKLMQDENLEDDIFRTDDGTNGGFDSDEEFMVGREALDHVEGDLHGGDDTDSDDDDDSEGLSGDDDFLLGGDGDMSPLSGSDDDSMSDNF